MKKFYGTGHPLCHPGYNFGAQASHQSSSQKSQSTAFQGIEDPFTLDTIKSLITSGGVTEDVLAQRAIKGQTREAALNAAGQYTRENAFADAQGAVDAAVRAQNEQNRPAIQRAVEGAGMSGSSMAALLSNDATTRAAQAGSTLAAQLAASYGNIQAGNLQTAANLSNVDATGINALLEAVKNMQISKSQSTGTAKSSGTSAGMTILGG